MEQSSIDVRRFVRHDLSGARINKIYRIKGVWILDVHKGERTFIKIKPGGIWFSKTKPHAGRPGGFVMQLRKHLEGKRIDRVRQLGWDRIVVFEVGDYELVAELFGKGNLILVKDGVIVGCEKRKEWRHRTIKPGEEYVPPPSGKNFPEMSWEEFKKLEGPAGRVLVRDLSLGEYGKKMVEGIEGDFEDLDEEKKRELFEKAKELVENPPEKEWGEELKQEKGESRELKALRESLKRQRKSVERNREKAEELREKGKRVMRELGRVEGLLREGREKMKTGEEMSEGKLIRSRKRLRLELE